MISGSRYVPVSQDATIATEPTPLSRNCAAPIVAFTKSVSARRTWLAMNSPGPVSAPSRRARSTSFNPNARSKSAMCFGDGWLTDAQLRSGSRERPTADKGCKGAQAGFKVHNASLYDRVRYVFFFFLH